MAEEKNGDLPASPIVVPEPGFQRAFLGLTKREKFAGMALQGQIAWEGMEGTDVEKNVAMAREYADALLKELEKNG